MTNDTTERDERMWLDGNRAAWVAMLGECLRQLGMVDNPSDRTAHLIERAQWTSEREQAIAVLRRLCDDRGDNNWPDNLALADIIGKHLGDYL